MISRFVSPVFSVLHSIQLSEASKQDSVTGLQNSKGNIPMYTFLTIMLNDI